MTEFGAHAQGAIERIKKREDAYATSVVHCFDQRDRYYVMHTLINERDAVEADLRHARVELERATEAVKKHEAELKSLNDTEQVILDAEPDWYRNGWKKVRLVSDVSGKTPTMAE